MNANTASLAMSRVVDRSESLEDWRTLEQLAANDPAVWQELVALLRDDCTLRHALEHELAPADEVDLELVPAAATAAPRRVSGHFVLGAAAALVLFLTLIWPSAGATPAASEPGQHLARYVDAGRRSGLVLEELPNVTLEVRPVPGEDGLEVIFMRRLVERAFVSEAWRMGTDEHGRPQPARADLAHYKRTSSF